MGMITLPENVFGVRASNSLVHQVVIGMQSNMRAGTANTKGRGEVRGGGKKPWKQKGTARARHGSIRSPIWKGGGVTHGPLKDKDYGKKINRKMKTKALYAVLSQKLKDGKLFFVDSITLSEPKTKEAKSVILGLSKIPGAKEVASKKRNAFYLAISKKNENVLRGFGNFSNAVVDDVRNMNIIDVLNHRYIFIANPEESTKVLESKIHPVKSRKASLAEVEFNRVK